MEGKKEKGDKGVHSAFEIFQNPFYSQPMDCRRAMHKLTDLINNISNIWSFQSQRLKTTVYTSIKRLKAKMDHHHEEKESSDWMRELMGCSLTWRCVREYHKCTFD